MLKEKKFYKKNADSTSAEADVNKPTENSGEADTNESIVNAEKIEKLEKIIEIMLSYASYENEGNNGLIKKISANKIPEEIIKKIKLDQNIDLENSVYAIKLLKIYSNGKGKLEFEMQKMAYDLVEAQTDRDLYAKIPRPIFYHEIVITNKDLLKSLNNDGISIGKNNKIEILLMDFIDGDDLAKKIYQDVLKQKEGYESSQIDEMSFPDLQNYVRKELDLREVEKKDRNNPEMINRVNNYNFELIINFLKRKPKYAFEKIILEKIKKTISLLHANSLYHRDLHERNIMITKDEKTAIKEVFLIDFGTAKIVEEKNDNSFVSKDGNNLLVDDRAIMIAYEPLTKTIADENNEEVLKFEKDINTLENKICKDQKWISFCNEIAEKKSVLAISKINNLTYSLSGTIQNDLYFQIRCAALRKAANYDKEFILDEIQKELKTTNPIGNKFLSNLYKLIKKP